MQLLLMLLGILFLTTSYGWIGIWTPIVGTIDMHVLFNPTLFLVIMLMAPFWFWRSPVWSRAQEVEFWQRNRWFAWILLHICLPIGMQIFTFGLRSWLDSQTDIENAVKYHTATLWTVYTMAVVISLSGVLSAFLW